MSARENAIAWLVALGYTGLVVGEAFVFPALLGATVGAVVALVFALAPLVGWTFWMTRP